MALATIGTPHTTLNGDPLRIIPVNPTGGSASVPADVRFKEGCQHRCHFIASYGDLDYFEVGRPVISAAAVPMEAETTGTIWDPELATGRITLLIDGVGTTSGWIHVWTAE